MEKRKSKLTWCSQARTKKDREDYFLDFVILLIFFEFLGYFGSTLLEIHRFCFIPSFTTRYTTYQVLTSTNFYPLFKGRDTAIFNFSIYHVFILGL
jgi:hypothetical protein